MDFNSIGCIAEYKFAITVMEHNINVSFPLLHSSPYDCITESINGFKKIQVKSASGEGDTVRCFLRNAKKKSYPVELVDYFAVWIESHNGFYILKNDGKITSITIKKNGKYLKNFNNFAIL
jgi:hypothetical protein